jgi:hypothetical protein
MPYSFDQPIVISKGNNKIGSIANVSLPPIASCQKDVPCAKQGCYSLKAYRRFKTVREARQHNWAVLNKDPDRFFKDIEDYLIDKKPRYFRWHVDGDIPSQSYLNNMIRVSEKFPAVKMLAFTKNYTLDISRLPQSLTIIPSLWPKHAFPKQFADRPVSWLYDSRDPEERLRGYYFECSGACTGCWACWHINELEKDVVFHKH